MSVPHRSAFLKTLAIFATAVSSMLFPLTSSAADFLILPNGSKVDLGQKCPVCGMVVGGPDGQGVSLTFKDGHVVGFHAVAAAVLKDGRVVGFEGARCLFIYNSVPEKYKVNVADIAHQYVTDYTSKKMIELPEAYLVLGSNVKSPMGYDLIPFGSKKEAAQFASENDGKWIVQLHEVARWAHEETGKSVPNDTMGNLRPGENRVVPPVPQVPIQTQDPTTGRSVKPLEAPPSRPFIFSSPNAGGGC